MTTERKYHCNICKDEITDKNPGIGFLFKSGDTEFEKCEPCRAENHLCNICIEATYYLFCKMKPQR